MKASSKRDTRSEFERRFGHDLARMWTVVVLGSVFSLGIIVTGYNHMRGENVDPVIMVGIIVPMGLLMGSILVVMLGMFTNIVNNLASAMHRVAEGDYSTRIDEGNPKSAISILYHDFNTMASELEGTELLREGFVADFSHEFKTPINSINGFANLLLEEEVPPEDEHLYLQIIARESDRLARLATNTLTLSRLDAQTILTERIPFALDERMRMCLATMLHQLEEKGVELEVDLEPATVAGNPEQLDEVWINLVGNAVKFTPAGGTITVGLRVEGEEAVATVRDTGIGMTDEQAARVFERYYQADESHATQGHGLGLSIAQRIVELHGGTIAANGTPGQGSTFTVRLPLYEEE